MARRGRRIRRIRSGNPHAPAPDASGSDDVFAFIAGYTEGGAPYGITWQAMEIDPDTADPDLDDLFAG
jgi:hypothetical protein